MGSLFSRIYISMSAAFIVIAYISYLGLGVINERRLVNYIDTVAKGTFILVAEGASRHEGLKQQKWIEIVERLTGLEFKLTTPSESDLSSSQLKQLNQARVFIQASNSKTHLVDIFAIIPAKDGKSSDGKSPDSKYPIKILSTQVKDINESLSRLTALLILNDLGRFPKNKRDQRLIDIKGLYGFDIKTLPINEAALTSNQRQRLKNRDTVISLKDSIIEPNIHVYMSLGNSGNLLELGPIPLFNWYPINLLILIGVLVLIFMAGASYFSVRPLETRLKLLSYEVSRLGSKKKLARVSITGSDAITNLASHINLMSDQIEQLLENQRDLTLAVSHDLKTPIARLKFRLTDIEDEVEALNNIKSKNAFNESLSGARKDIFQLESLLQEILSYAELERDDRTINISKFNIKPKLEKLIDDLSVLHPNIEIKLDNHLNTISADSSLLSRAIENLTTNACRHAKSRVLITSQIVDSMFEISIKDDGQGVPIEHQHKIFEPFYRIDSSRNIKSGGTGLGLSIVERIMKLHSGKSTYKLLDNSDYASEFMIQWPTKKEHSDK